VTQAERTLLLTLSSVIVFIHKQVVMMQEIAFFEEGEPMIDGEPGDLKVGNTTPMLRIAAMLFCFNVSSFMSNSLASALSWNLA